MMYKMTEVVMAFSRCKRKRLYLTVADRIWEPCAINDNGTATPAEWCRQPSEDQPS
jgi:hypothetical protein